MSQNVYNVLVTKLLPGQGKLGQSEGAIVLESTADALTAATGSDQASGIVPTTTVSRVTTVGTAGDAVTLPVAVPGMVLVVINAAAANAMDVFPAVNGYINAGAQNAAFSVPAARTAVFFCAVAGKWSGGLLAAT